MKYSNIEKKKIGNRIRAIRTSLGLTMSQFGDRVDNAPQSIVSRWENGQSVPNAERLKTISRLGNKTTNWLLNGDQLPSSLDNIYDLVEDLGKVKSEKDSVDYVFDTLTSAIKRYSNSKEEMELLGAIMLDIFTLQTQFQKVQSNEISASTFSDIKENFSKSILDDIDKLIDFYGNFKVDSKDLN